MFHLKLIFPKNRRGTLFPNRTIIKYKNTSINVNFCFKKLFMKRVNHKTVRCKPPRQSLKSSTSGYK